MKPLLKSLMGNGGKDQETLEAMRAVLAEIQRERTRLEGIVEGAQAGAERLKQLGEPLAKTEGDVDSLANRVAQMEERFQGMVKLAGLFQNLDERAEGLTKSTQWAESRLAVALEGSQKIESTMAELVSKVDLAADLKERLTSFLEVEKPFQLLRGDAHDRGRRPPAEGEREVAGRARRAGRGAQGAARGGHRALERDHAAPAPGARADRRDAPGPGRHDGRDEEHGRAVRLRVPRARIS